MGQQAGAALHLRTPRLPSPPCPATQRLRRTVPRSHRAPAQGRGLRGGCAARRAGPHRPGARSRMLVRRGPEGWSARSPTSTHREHAARARRRTGAARPLRRPHLFRGRGGAARNRCRRCFRRQRAVRGPARGRRAAARAAGGRARLCARDALLAQPASLLRRVRRANAQRQRRPCHEVHHDACGIDHFPRLDPAIIVLVTDGERALLGRQASWPAGRYSTIAGFVEPGESLEDAVAREVLEETGVDGARIEYHSSQPWPFPSSLMIGFTARAAAESVPRADEELEDVRWFTRAGNRRRVSRPAATAVGLVPADRALVRRRLERAAARRRPA